MDNNTPDGLPPAWAEPVRILLRHGDIITVNVAGGGEARYQVTAVTGHGNGAYSYDLQPVTRGSEPEDT